MQDRPIKGTTGWKRHDIVLDVPGKTPEDATETLKQLFASMIMDLQEKYPVARKE